MKPAPTIEQVQTAVHTWARVATGLPATSVIWRSQNGPRPARPFVELSLGDSQSVGTGWTVREDNSTPTPEHEILYRARGQERVRLGFQAFSDATTGSGRADWHLKRIRGWAQLPDIKALLRAVPIGVATFQPILILSMLDGQANHLSRASMDCFAYLPTEFLQSGTHIESEDHTVTLTP